MKKDVFADWLRELCMLVFIQTVQAFIFAIVMSLIISVLSNFPEDKTDAVASTGVIAVIVLASVSKIEEIVKKIFGIKSGFHDSGMRGGLKSLATTMMAAGLAKGVLDNGRKAVGGLLGVPGAAITAHRDTNKAKARLARGLGRSETPGGSLPAGGGNQSPTAGEYLEKAREAKANGDMRGYERNRGIAAGMNKAAVTPSSGSTSSASKDLQKKYDEYEDKIADIKSKRNAAMRNSAFTALSGGLETLGAIGGGTLGAVAGAAVGEGKEIIQGGLAGMGAGDKIGSIPASALNKTTETVGNIRSAAKSQAELTNQISKATAEAREAIDKRRTAITKYREANKQLDKMLEQIDAGNM